jgi:GT2 family glycosyltransferase
VERLESAAESAQLTAPPSRLHEAGGETLCSVVIPSYNGRELLARCLASIERHRPTDPGLLIEVIVVDDASTDGTAEWLASEHLGVHLVCLERNGGFCAAANAGIAAARGRFIQLLNNDTEVGPGWIEAGLAPFADATVGAVAPLVLVRSDPSRVDSAGDSYALVGWPTKRGHGEPALGYATRPVEEVFGASGSSAFYRARALRLTGRFDPLFGSYYEDIDLAFRLRWAGYRCVFAPTCLVYHDVSATYNHGNPALQRRLARNAEIVFWANLPGGLLGLALLPHLAFVVAQGLWRLARGRLRPFVLGKYDAVRAWREIQARRTLRAELSREAVAAPHFALGLGSARDVRNHLRRPASQSPRTVTTHVSAWFGRDGGPPASGVSPTHVGRKPDTFGHHRSGVNPPDSEHALRQ